MKNSRSIILMLSIAVIVLTAVLYETNRPPDVSDHYHVETNKVWGFGNRSLPIFICCTDSAQLINGIEHRKTGTSDAYFQQETTQCPNE